MSQNSSNINIKSQAIKIINEQFLNPSFDKKYQGTNQETANYYYKQARNLYIANIVLNNQLKTVKQEKKYLQDKLKSLIKDDVNPQQDKSKRIRKKASEVIRSFHCRLCSKAYGTQGSLSQHVKLKHSSYNIGNQQQKEILKPEVLQSQ